MFSFCLCDPDKDGRITHAELVRILRALCLAADGAKEGRCAQEITNDVFAAVDTVCKFLDFFRKFY